MSKEKNYDDLKLMVFKSARELGEMVDDALLDMYGLSKEDYSFIIPIKEIFFEDGHLKVEILNTVRAKNMFFLTDVGNYSIEYKMHGFINHASPNDLAQQLKDGIHACDRHPDFINVVMPLLYNGRQHRRKTRESLACGEFLRELDQIKGAKSIITFDAHDQGVEHAVHNMEFDNFNVNNTILDSFVKDRSLDELKKIVLIAPDSGATERIESYLDSFASPYVYREMGHFSKKRDLNNFVDGKYPIIAHEYSGNNDLEGMTAIITDDMISSGGSMIDVVHELKKRKAEKVYAFTTFVLFTKGIDEFDKLYKEGKFNGLYTTNLSYIPEEYKKCEWLHICDCSKELANIIYNIHNDLSISSILRDKEYSVKLLEKKFTGKL